MARKKKKDYAPCDNVPWRDIGTGACARCSDERRLYRPETEPKTEGVCAPCTQVRAYSAIPTERANQEDNNE